MGIDMRICTGLDVDVYMHIYIYIMCIYTTHTLIRVFKNE